MKTRLKIAYADFWPGFDPNDNYLTRTLGAVYELVFSDDPEVLFFSCFGTRHHQYRCLKVFYTAENVRPDYRVCDYAFSFDYLDEPRHYRLPNFLWYAPERLVRPPDFDPERVLAEKTSFCNFVYSNPIGLKRNRFFEKLSRYKHVDAGGRLFNNIGGPVADKGAFLKAYKFTIAFENASYPGYTTEKIADPMKAWSLPIYWGNPVVHLDFNPASFLNYADFDSDEALIERLIALDRDDALYLSYLAQPWLYENRLPATWQTEAVQAAFAHFLDTAPRPVAQKSVYFFVSLPDRWRHHVAKVERQMRRTLVRPTVTLHPVRS